MANNKPSNKPTKDRRVYQPSDLPDVDKVDEVKLITDKGWLHFTESDLPTDDHFDRLARAGVDFLKEFPTNEILWATKIWTCRDGKWVQAYQYHRERDDEY
jgi:hypothetical protein